MNTFPEKLERVRRHYLNGDLHLGFRQLTDCILDTQDMAFYRTWIAYTEWLEGAERPEGESTGRALSILNELSGVELKAKPLSGEPLLSTEKLAKTYGRGRFQLGEIDLAIYPGNVWGLVGENGNGKTTLLRILAKDLSFSSGTLSYHLEGKMPSDYELRTRLTYIPQRTPKWYGSLKANLKFTATHYGIKGEENELLVLMMIIRFGLWNYRNHQWSELSSGYKMRFELARTFLRAPRILLLDEPLANLDVLAQQLILEDLKSLAQSISNPIGIVLSSQQLFEVEKVADNVLFLKQGTPTRLDDANTGIKTTTVIEFDAETDRETLMQAFAGMGLTDLAFNGGMYIATFNEAGKMHDAMTAFVRHNIPVKYIRDISLSTRRLFI